MVNPPPTSPNTNPNPNPNPSLPENAIPIPHPISFEPFDLNPFPSSPPSPVSDPIRRAHEAENLRNTFQKIMDGGDYFEARSVDKGKQPMVMEATLGGYTSSSSDSDVYCYSGTFYFPTKSCKLNSPIYISSDSEEDKEVNTKIPKQSATYKRIVGVKVREHKILAEPDDDDTARRDVVGDVQPAMVVQPVRKSAKKRKAEERERSRELANKMIVLALAAPNAPQP